MNVLISVKEGISLGIIAGIDYPIVETTSEYVAIATSNEPSANNISGRIGGEVHETPNSEFPYEVRVKLTKFNKIIEANDWPELISKHFV
jgi:hypothetical protein